MKSINKLLAFCAGTIALSASSIAQWSHRYNYPDNDNDRANCVAVDKRGNIYVAGNVETNGQQVNVIVHSYNALGSPRSGWPAEYNFSGVNKDDYATSIHVDDDFNVYVAGTSDGGSTTFYDFFVWKLDTNGQRVWPTSGGGTGYAFDNYINSSNDQVKLRLVFDEEDAAQTSFTGP